jgi:predicted nuclease of predicted toxin-antitoxin system
LSLKIYLDDCVCAKELVGMLRAKGHDVLTPNDTGTVGESDETHLNTAIAQTRVLITADVEDFSELHRLRPNHDGIFAICQDKRLTTLRIRGSRFAVNSAF